MTSKLLSIKCCPPKQGPLVPSLSTQPPRGGSYRYFVRGKTYMPTQVSKFLLLTVGLVPVMFVGRICFTSSKEKTFKTI